MDFNQLILNCRDWPPEYYPSSQDAFDDLRVLLGQSKIKLDHQSLINTLNFISQLGESKQDKGLCWIVQKKIESWGRYSDVVKVQSDLGKIYALLLSLYESGVVYKSEEIKILLVQIFFCIAETEHDIVAFEDADFETLLFYLEHLCYASTTLKRQHFNSFIQSYSKLKLNDVNLLNMASNFESRFEEAVTNAKLDV